MLIHATAIIYRGDVLLLRGDSGAGKSDLALRLIADGAKLIGNDYVHIEPQKGRLIVKADPELHGMIEVRGIGIVYVREVMPLDQQYPVSLVVDLVPRNQVPRMPETEDGTISLENIPVKRIALHAFDASTPIKIGLACGHDIG